MEADLASIALILLLLVVSAFFSGSEVAFLAVGDTRLRYLSQEGSRLARLVTFLRRHRTWVLSTVLTAITVSNYTAERLATRLSVEHIGSAAGPIIAYLAVIVIVLIFCEVTPIQYAVRHAEATALRTAVPITIFAALLTPAVLVLTAIARGLLFLGGVRRDTVPAPITEDQLKGMIEQGEEQGTVPTVQQRMLYGALDFGDQTVAQVMTPRPDIVWVGSDQTLQEALELGIQQGFSRLPVCEGSPDKIVGVIHIKDVLPYLRKGEMDKSVRRVARPPMFVPESLPANVLLRQLQASRRTIAIIKDEFGGTAGLVTVEDLLEEIVGEITDEYDVEESEIQAIGERELLCDARISLHLLANYVPEELPETEYDSLGGLILDIAGHIPAEGEEVSWGRLRLVVAQTVGNRIEKVRVIQLPQEADE